MTSSLSSSALSLSALMAEAKAPPLPLLTTTSDAVVADACTDVARELAAMDARLQRMRQQRSGAAAAPHFLADPLVAKRLLSSQPEQQQQQRAGQVADEVESALSACERLLQRAKAAATTTATGVTRSGDAPGRVRRANRYTDPCYVNASANASPLSSTPSSRVSTSPSSFAHTHSTPTRGELLYKSRSESPTLLAQAAVDSPMASTPPTSTFIRVKTMSSPASSPARSAPDIDPLSGFTPTSGAGSTEERELEARAAAIKSFAARCQQEMQSEAATIQQQQHSLQTTFLKELQRKYESKKKMSILALKESFERETNALVRDRMDEYEQEQARVLSKLEEELVRERDRALNEAVAKHELELGEQVKRLEARLLAETTSRRKLLENRLQAELEQMLGAMEIKSEESMRSWEAQKRLEQENELFMRREQAATAILRQQEARTAELKREVEQQHAANERAELEKLKKALAFGAQAQLQQLRKRLESDHDAKLSEAKADAARSSEQELDQLKQVLLRAHRESESKLRRELEKKHRIAMIELQESLQATHHSNMLNVKAKADRECDAELAASRQEAALAHQRQLEELEQTLELDLRVRSNQAQIEMETSFARSLDSLREKLLEGHCLELTARTARMERARAALLSEAKAFLSIEARPAESVGELSESSRRLSDLKRHLSGELAKYVEILVGDFDEMTEEQRILVTKITELTQLYLSFKRQCEKLETESGELKSAMHALHLQLQNKDAMCKKLYEANEALLKRLQQPAAGKLAP